MYVPYSAVTYVPGENIGEQAYLQGLVGKYLDLM